MKRTAEQDGEPAGKKPKVEVDPNVIEFRFLIDSKQVGIIIGKGGTNVKRIRTESGVYCSILKLDPAYRNATERIMTVKGLPAAVANGVRLICEILLGAQVEREQKAAESSGDVTLSETITIKLLIHKLSAGSVIGKAGSIIKEIVSTTGARVQLSQEALGASTEKTVSITGSPQAVHDAISRVLNQLRDNPIKPGAPSQPYVPGVPAFAPPPFAYPPPRDPAYGYAPAYAPPPASYPPPGPGSAVSVVGGATQKIAIPTVCAGSVIGKGGSIIRDLKAQSGCNISLADPEAASPQERVVTISGTPQGIQHAIFLIRQVVEQYPQGAPAAAAYGAPY